MSEKQKEAQALSDFSIDMNIKNELEANPHYLSGNPIDNQKWEAYEGSHNNITTG